MDTKELKKPKRIEVVDALRGFAIMAIMILHNMERFNIYTFPDPKTLPSWMVTADTQIWDSLFFLFGGKAYAIFAFLFGFTFFLQYNKQKSIGKDFGYVYLWRILLMVGFALINAAFFPGDVLMLFAVVGLSLFVIRHWSTKRILIFAFILLLQPIELGRYIAHLIDPDYLLPERITGIYHSAFKETIKTGNLFETIWANLTNGQAFSFMWAVENGRFIQTAGVMMLGTVTGRAALFNKNDQTKKFWTRLAIGGVIASAILHYCCTTQIGGLDPISKQTLGAAMKMWRNLAFTSVLVSVFTLLYNYTNTEKLASKLIPYGKMSLTNYIGQSIIGFIIYFPVMINLSPYITKTYSVLLGIVLFMIQLQICKWWLKTHKQGPLEQLWHKLTWIFSKE